MLSISIEIFSSMNILCKFYAIFVVVVVAVGWIDGGEGCTATPEEDVIY